MRRNNFGRRLLARPLDPSLIVDEVMRYDAADAARVCDRVRDTAGLGAQLDELVALYAEVVAEQAASVVDLGAEGRAAAAYFRQWVPRFRDGDLRSECDRRGLEVARLTSEVDGFRTELERLAGSATWRLHDRLIRSRTVVSLYRAARGVMASVSGWSRRLTGRSRDNAEPEPIQPASR
jgi:hypothetical protein